jgi:hypothetical protein
VLALALTQHEDGLCSGCGQPLDRSWNVDMADYYAAHRRTCLGCQSVADDLDAHGALKSAETLSVSDDAPEGFEPDVRMMPKG